MSRPPLDLSCRVLRARSASGQVRAHQHRMHIDNPATRNRTRDHLIAAGFYSQMLYQLSYSRNGNVMAESITRVVKKKVLRTARGFLKALFPAMLRWVLRARDSNKETCVGC